MILNKEADRILLLLTPVNVVTTKSCNRYKMWQVECSGVCHSRVLDMHTMMPDVSSFSGKCARIWEIPGMTSWYCKIHCDGSESKEALFSAILNEESVR